jgi:hypothetical protein
MDNPFALRVALSLLLVLVSWAVALLWFNAPGIAVALVLCTTALFVLPPSL